MIYGLDVHKEHRIAGTEEAITDWERKLGPRDHSLKARQWMRSLEFPPTERFLLHNSLGLLEAIDERIAAADAELLATRP